MEEGSNPCTVNDVEVPRKSLCSVKEETSGDPNKSCFDAGTGYIPSIWNTRSEAIAPLSSFPGIYMISRYQERKSI